MNQDLTGLINRAVAETLTPEFVEKEVKSRIEKLIIETINHAMRSYSDTGKMIEAAVTEALKVDRLDLPSYGLMIMDMLKTQIEATVSPLIAGRLASDMAELLKLAPKEIKLSAIVADMVKERKEDGEYGPDLVTCIIEETDYGWFWVYLDPRTHYTDREKHQCDFRLSVSKEGEITSGTFNGTEYKTGAGSKKTIGRCYGLEQQFRAMIACNTRIIIDESEISTGWED